MKKLLTLFAILMLALPLFAKGKKDTSLTGTLKFYGSAPVNLFVGLTTEDGKQYALDLSKCDVTLDDLSELQGYKVECSGKLLKRKKNAPLQLNSLKDGVIVLSAYKKVGE